MNPGPDYKQLSRQLVRSLRRDSRQVTLSRNLGYSFNQVAKWEAGDKRVLWREFVRICEAQGFDLALALKACAFRSLDPRDPRTLLAELRGRQSIAGFARDLSAGRIRLSRWLSGRCDLPLEEFLRALDAKRGNAARFCGFFSN